MARDFCLLPARVGAALRLPEPGRVCRAPRAATSTQRAPALCRGFPGRRGRGAPPAGTGSGSSPRLAARLHAIARASRVVARVQGASPLCPGADIRGSTAWQAQTEDGVRWAGQGRPCCLSFGWSINPCLDSN